MRVGLRIFRPETITWLRAALRQGQLSRAALGRGVCEREDWRNPKGEYCTASARKALPALATQLDLPLPPAQPGPPACRPRSGADPPVASTSFRGSLEALGEVRVGLVSSAAERRLCAALLDQHHPLGRARAPGCRLSYLLTADHGPLGVLSFVAAPFRLGPRDACLQWDERTRGAHIERILHNDRFLLVPGVQVPQLASHVLGKTVRRLARDWEQAHGVRPWLVETCVHSARPGTSYKAAGWQCVGSTQGRPPGAAEAVATKAVWLLGLAPDWQRKLCQQPQPKLGQYPELVLEEEATWACREFLRSDLPDGRLRARLEQMGQSWERHPGEDLPAIFPHPAELRAATRLLHNGRVRSTDILQPHREALLERVQVESTVLLVQDTTTLNYTHLRGSTSGLGPLQDRASSARGLFVHAAVGFTEGGRPLGVSGLERWARPEQDPGRDAEREKESQRWFRGLAQGQELGRCSPQTRVVVVGDRESDIFALFERQAERRSEAGLLVRVHLGRQRKVQVWDAAFRSEMIRPIEAQPDFEEALVTGRAVEIESQGGSRAREKRTAVTEIRIGRVEVLPPKERIGKVAPLPVWLVRVLEPDPPDGEEGLEWLLLSSEGAATAQWAERIVSWYERRWGIEEYFRLLKTGTRIEDRRLRDAEALGKCLVFDAITAWRVFSLERYARDAPDTPAEEVLTADEMAVIEGVTEAERLRPPRERGQPVGPDIRSWVVLLARMRGWRPKKRRELPGNEVLWKAYQPLQIMVRYRQSLRGPP